LIAWIAAFFTATTIVLGLILARTMDDRDRWNKRAAAHLMEVQEARAAAVMIRKALDRSKKETAKARADHEAARDKIRAARSKIDKAAGDAGKVAELWNDALKD